MKAEVVQESSTKSGALREEVLDQLQKNRPLWEILEKDDELRETLIRILQEIVVKEQEVRASRKNREEKEGKILSRIFSAFSAP